MERSTYADRHAPPALPIHKATVSAEAHTSETKTGGLCIVAPSTVSDSRHSRDTASQQTSSNGNSSGEHPLVSRADTDGTTKGGKANKEGSFAELPAASYQARHVAHPAASSADKAHQPTTTESTAQKDNLSVSTDAR